MPMTASSPPPGDAEAERVIRLARDQTAKVMRKIPLLGTVSWLMLAAPSTRHTLLSDLEWRVMPALVLNQAKIYMREDTPVAYVSWARLSPEVARRFRAMPHRLAPGEWKCGPEVWLVDVLAPFGGIQEVMRDLRANVLPGEVLRQLALTGDAEAEVYTWPAG